MFGARARCGGARAAQARAAELTTRCAELGEEVKLLLNEHFLMKYVDFYTGLVRGQLDEVVVDTLLDLVDKNGDGEIKCDEFAKEVLGGSNTYFFSDMAEGYQSTFDVQGL